MTAETAAGPLKLFTYNEVAAILGVSKTTLQQWVELGALNYTFVDGVHYIPHTEVLRRMGGMLRPFPSELRNMLQDESLMSCSDVALHAGVHRNTVCSKVDRGKIEARRCQGGVWLIPVREAEALRAERLRECAVRGEYEDARNHQFRMFG